MKYLNDDKIVRILHSLAALLLLVSLPSAGCRKEALLEKEGNNSFATANPIELQKDISGYLQDMDDRDYYSFSVPHRMVLDLSVSGIKGVNHSIKVWKGGEQPVLVKLIDDSRKSSPERMINLTAEEGRYFISIQHGDGDRRVGAAESPYTLHISYRDFVSEEAEPNDIPLQATPLSFGQELTGYFSPAYNRLNAQDQNQYREEDWFSFQADAEPGKPMLLEVSLSAVPGVNSILQLCGPDMQLLAQADNNQAGLGEEFRGIGITEPGTYYLMVSSLGYGANTDMPYHLTINKREFDPSMEMEPNDSPEKAGAIVRNMVRGAINSPNDADYFHYSSEGITGTYRLTLTPDGKSDLMLSVFSRKGKKIIEINNGGPGEQEVYPDFTFGGDFLCAVSAVSTDADKNSYQLTIEPLLNIRGLEVEPNDTKEEATMVTGAEIRGYTSTARDRDYYYLKYERRVRLEAAVKGVRDGIIRVSITDPLGYILRTKTVQGDSLETLSEMIDGGGYLLVETVKASYDNPYEIEVRKK